MATDPDKRPEPTAPVRDTFQQLEQLRVDLAEQFDRLRGLFDSGRPFTPLADVVETDDAFLVEIELPGTRRDDVEITTAGRRLTVTGERKERERIGILRKRTRTVGEFRYEVVLPGDFDLDAVTAGFEDGVLSVRLPKPEAERARRIPIT